MTSPLPPTHLQQLLATGFPGALVTIHDNSAQHAGHAGSGGGGHYTVQVVWAGFEGHNRLNRQRLVHRALAAPLQAGRIHALTLSLRTPSEAA